MTETNIYPLEYQNVSTGFLESHTGMAYRMREHGGGRDKKMHKTEQYQLVTSPGPAAR